MIIKPISGVTGIEPSFGVSLESEKRASELTVVAQENTDKNSMKTGIDNQKFEVEEKGVKKVDVKI